MNNYRIYHYLTLAALFGFWSCSSSRQTAQNVGEADDLYGTSGNAVVYASTSSDPSSVVQRPSSRQPQRSLRNANPDYADDQQGYSTNTDEYYTELSARKLNRGLSADPGWSDNGTNAYNSGFVNGYNSATTSAYSWNRWGSNNMGLNIGLGMGSFGYSPWSIGFGRPFYGNSFGYSPFGYGGGYYDPFYSSSYGGYNNFYNPFYSPFGYSAYGGFGGYGGYGGFYGQPVYVNNVIVTGADPYRRTYTSSYNRSAGRFNDGFVNAPRTNDPNAGGRRYSGSSATGGSANSSDGYYARPRQNGGGGYYYDNGTASGSRSGSFNNAPSAPAYSSGNSGSSSDYYARPRQNGTGGSYSGGNASGSRGSYSQPSYQQPSYQQPSYQNQSRGSYNTPSYSAPSYSAPSRSGGGGGGGGGSISGGGGGGSRGPR